MRIFGSKTLENVLNKLGLKEGEAITHTLITRALEKAQQKVESHNYDIRKQILKFDDILNDQRKIIYQNRREILTTEDQSKIIQDMIDFNLEYTSCPFFKIFFSTSESRPKLPKNNASPRLAPAEKNSPSL